MSIPKTITFTGVDSQTDLSECQNISRKYKSFANIEWGVLHSFSRMGVENRYPDMKTLFEIPKHIDKRNLSAHLCGQLARDFKNFEFNADYFNSFDRIQVNSNEYNISDMNEMSRIYGTNLILQHRDEFPNEMSDVFYLFDKSGGKGIEQNEFPAQSFYDHYVGYAGGFNSENVVSKLKLIEASNFWIDMESGVRSNDWFDLYKCKEVIEKIIEYKES